MCWELGVNPDLDASLRCLRFSNISGCRQNACITTTELKLKVRFVYLVLGWCICTLSQSEVNSKKYLMISRVEAFKPAAIVNISLSKCEEQVIDQHSI